MVEKDDESPPKVEDTEAAASSIASIREMHNLSVHDDGSRSPFTSLPSLVAIALIMGYYGYTKQIKALLN